MDMAEIEKEYADISEMEKQLEAQANTVTDHMAELAEQL